MPALLFDENLSHRLVNQLADEFPGSLHPETLGWRGRPDIDLWRLAVERALVLVSKDDDFRQMAILRGPPPKVVWLAIGNTTTSIVADILRAHARDIASFASEPETAILILGA